MATIRRIATEELRPRDVAFLRELFDAAWPDPSDRFAETDWEHAMTGLHFLVFDGDRIVSAASVARRLLETNGRGLATGYVEAVATHPDFERRGLATAVMREVGDYIDGEFELGALGTGIPSFYERLGWVVWGGPTFVRTHQGLVRTPEDDGAVLVRLTPRSPKLDVTAPISCEWRSGDVW